MTEITIHDEQGRLRGVEAYVRKYCTAIASNFRDTEAELYKLLSHFEDNPVYITARADGQRTRVDVYINANSRKALAEAVVYEVGHYFGNPDTKPENAKDTAIIDRKAEAWLQAIPDTYITKPDLYPGRVFHRAMLELQAAWGSKDPKGKTPPSYDFPPEGIILDGCKLSDGESAAIIEAVGRWVKRQDQAPTAQQLSGQPTTISEGLRIVLNKAVESGFVAKEGGGYRWTGTRDELQLFGTIAHENGLTRYKWKDLERLFNKKNLAQDKYKADTFTGAPKRAGDIEQLFK